MAVVGDARRGAPKGKCATRMAAASASWIVSVGSAALMDAGEHVTLDARSSSSAMRTLEDANAIRFARGANVGPTDAAGRVILGVVTGKSAWGKGSVFTAFQELGLA